MVKALIICLVLLCPLLSYAHTEDLYPDYLEIFKREDYIAGLEKTLKKDFNSHFSLSLFGIEMEHILILSPSCKSIKNYNLTGARGVGIISCTCRWYDGQLQLKLARD